MSLDEIVETETTEEAIKRIDLELGVKNVLSIAGPEGDVQILWDPRIPEEVETAKASFKKSKKAGMLAYSVEANGEKGEVIHEFDPHASKIIMTKQLQGG